MELDKKMLEQLLSLGDTELLQAITLIARESGIDTEKLNLSGTDISKLRSVLGSATDEDIRRASELLQKRRFSQRGDL